MIEIAHAPQFTCRLPTKRIEMRNRGRDKPYIQATYPKVSSMKTIIQPASLSERSQCNPWQAVKSSGPKPSGDGHDAHAANNGREET